MPKYVYSTLDNEKYLEVIHSMAECDRLSDETRSFIAENLGTNEWKRVIFAPNLVGFDGATSYSKRKLSNIRKKQNLKKSSKHFADNTLRTLDTQSQAGHIKRLKNEGVLKNK